MPDLSEMNESLGSSGLNHSVDFLSAARSPQRSSLLKNAPQTRYSDMYTYGSNSHMLESATVSERDTNLTATRSQPLLDVTPAPPPPPPLSQQLCLDRRCSNSTGSVSLSPRQSMEQSSESVDALNAEPYLQPMEVQIVMSTLPRTQKLPESTSFHSIQGDTLPVSGTHRQIPIQASAVDISLTPSHHREGMAKFGHRRTASNPWILEAGNREPPLTPKLPSPLPPPIPARDYQRPSKSPPLLNPLSLDPHESSLDFPNENWISVASISLSPKSQCAQQPQYVDIDDVDKLSTISGPFEEISDGPDSAPETTNSNHVAKSNSQAKLVKKKSSTLNSDYEKIEEYIVMAPSSSTLPRRSILSTDTPNLSNSGGDRTPKKTSVGPLIPKAKKPKGSWSRQSADSVIPDASTIRSSSPPLFPATRRFTMLDNPQPSSSTPPRPLPPSPSKSAGSPTKKVRGNISRNSSSGSNIYETIDEEMLSRVYSRRRGSGLPKWAPPVAPKHYAQYLVILRKFFTDPRIIEAWDRTVQEIIPGGDIATYPPPYSNLARQQGKKLGPTVEVPLPRAGSAEPAPSSRKIVRQVTGHSREGSHDQYVLPILTPQKTEPHAANEATPDPSLDGGASAVFPSTRRAQFAANRPNSREDLIEMLNMSSFNQGDSSESGSSESETSDEEESDEREEEEGEESEDGEAVVVEEGGEEVEGGDGVKKGESEVGGGGEGKESSKGIAGEVVKDVQNEEVGERVRGIEKDETDNDDVIVGVAEQSPSPPRPQSSSERHRSIEEEFDSILTKLNPILSAFDSILDTEDALIPTTSETEQATPQESAHSHANSALSPQRRNQDSSRHKHAPTQLPQREHGDSSLRASVSTDSDLDSSPLVKPSALFSKSTTPPSAGSRIKRWVNSFERKESEDGFTVDSKQSKRPPPPVPKRKPTRRREAVAGDGMSDSGISNCHSQTFEDGFNALDNN